MRVFHLGVIMGVLGMVLVIISPNDWPQCFWLIPGGFLLAAYGFLEPGLIVSTPVFVTLAGLLLLVVSVFGDFHPLARLIGFLLGIIIALVPVGLKAVNSMDPPSAWLGRDGEVPPAEKKEA